jgi:all-trans-retinol dehydrogenase (NAD+)
MNIKGMKAIVTGGAMGIGLATTHRLLASGCQVTVWDFNPEALLQAKKDTAVYDRMVFFHACDVTNRVQVRELARQAAAEMGGIDILINNAGVVFPGNFQDVEDHLHDKTYAVNLLALTYSINAVLPDMYTRNRGVVVNISSAAGVVGVGGMASYAASKWAVWGLTESLRHEAANQKKNVRFISIHPGYLANGLFEGARMKGLGALFVPPIKSHDVIANAIVTAIERNKTTVFRPGSIRMLVLVRGLFPDRWLFWISRILNVHSSINGWKGRNHA